MGRSNGESPDLGRQVQVGNNFMVVYPTAKYPKREVIYKNSDYIQETRLSQGANFTRSKASINIDYQLGREAKVVTHNRFGPVIPEVYRFKSKNVHKKRLLNQRSDCLINVIQADEEIDVVQSDDDSNTIGVNELSQNHSEMSPKLVNILSHRTEIINDPIEEEEPEPNVLLNIDSSKYLANNQFLHTYDPSEVNAEGLKYDTREVQSRTRTNPITEYQESFLDQVSVRTQPFKLETNFDSRVNAFITSDDLGRKMFYRDCK